MKSINTILLTMLIIVFAGQVLAKPGVVQGPKKQPIIPEERDEEQEPNNSCDSSYWMSRRVALGEISTTGDRDYYKFEVVSGNVVTVRTFATFDNQFDTEIILFNEDCSSEYGYNDDYTSQHYFSEVSPQYLDPGIYTVMVKGYIDQETGPYGLVVIGADNIPYNETEPNDDYLHANNPDYESFCANIDTKNDIDMYRITIGSSDQVTFTTENVGYANMDTEMVLTTALRDQILAYSDDYQTGSYFSQINYSFSDPGIYYLIIKGFEGNEVGPYGLSLMGCGVVEDQDVSWGQVKQMFN